MSSNIRIPKICGWCKKEFIAQKTTTKCCSNLCCKRYHKHVKREEKISQAILREEVLKAPRNYVSEELMKTINAKELLNLKEAALFICVSDLTMRRWILAGKVASRRMGKKHLILKKDLLAMP